MILKPDLERPIIDPFNSHTTLNIFCDILDAVKKILMKEILEGLQKKLSHISRRQVSETNHILDQSRNFLFLTM